MSAMEENLEVVKSHGKSTGHKNHAIFNTNAQNGSKSFSYTPHQMSKIWAIPAPPHLVVGTAGYRVWPSRTTIYNFVSTFWIHSCECECHSFPFTAEFMSEQCDFENPFLCGYHSFGWVNTDGDSVINVNGPMKDSAGSVLGNGSVCIHLFTRTDLGARSSRLIRTQLIQNCDQFEVLWKHISISRVICYALHLEFGELETISSSNTLRWN